jgi:transglutaminase-like putative cysteine protease/tetratricopeptide (TPR) repeat protein
MNNFLLFAVLVAYLPLASLDLPAQVVVPKPEKVVAKDYADEAAVVERDELVYRYAADGTGVKTETTALRVQSSAALQAFAVLGFPYASGTQALEIVYARVRKRDGTVVETPAGDAQDQPAQATQVAPMYSDLHLKQLPVRSLAVGDTLEFETKVTQKRAEVPGEFWNAESFGVGLVYLDRRIELRVPKSKVVTVYSPKYPPETVESGDERVYRWKGAQLRRSNAKDEDVALQDKTPPIAWTTFPSWEAVGAWYQTLIAGRDAVTPALQAKADEVTAGAKTDAEKVRRLYEYVSQHNHYIGVEFGVGRYQPHTAMEVLTNQYGDCKDKHTLLAALLRAEGFQPSAVLIAAGVGMNEKVPTPGAFNHLITLVNVDGGPVWLDATTEVAPYRVLLSVLRDKEALVVPAKSGPGVPHLAKTPAELPFAAVDRYEGAFELAKDGTTMGNVAVTMRGDDEVLMRYASRQVARAQWDQLGQSYVDNSGFNGKANSVTLDTGDDLSVPWGMRYGYTQDAWSQWKSYQIGSLLPNVNLPSIDEKKPPKEEIDFGGRHTQIAKSTVKLPVGYGAELPDAIHLKTTFATFDETYRITDGSLVSEFTLEVLKPKVEAAEWKSVKKLADAVTVQPWIQLMSKELTAGEKGPPAAGENNRVAAELVRQTHDAIMSKDFELAQKKSDQAIAINEKQAYAWSQRGWLAWQYKNLGEAANDYERELRQHPEEDDQYPDLIRLERLQGRPSEERKYLLAYAEAAPVNAQAVLFVGSQLLASNHVDDAVEVYRAGVKALPDNRMIQVELGSALLRAGKKIEAVSIVEKALDGTSDENVLNDGAYALVSTGSSALLPLAEASVRKAVETLETESAGTAIEGVNTGTFGRTNLLLATWDTLGWIYFAEGKDVLAEEYVRASWRSKAHGEAGLHMGEILEKKGDAKGAMQVYEMALGRTGSSSSATSLATELHSRVDGLMKKGLAVQDAQPDQALQEQRTFHVPRPSGVKGSGVFVIQISAAKTEHVAMVSGGEGLRGLSEAVGRLDLGLAVPKESHALLLRSGVLFCSTEVTCEFVLTTPESANVM